MSLRVASSVVVVVAVLGAFTAAVASAVRTSRGVATAPSGRVLAMPVAPGVTATAPAATPPLGLGPRLPATPGPELTEAPRPVPRSGSPSRVVPVPARASRAVGRPNGGRLENGVLLPAEGPDHTTWDAVEQVSPNPDWRRVGTDRLVERLLTVAATYRRANPGAPRVVVSDLSLPEGGRFGPEYGGLGHASHQNGLDVDIAYPRADRREVGIRRVREVDRELAQALVDTFVEAGAQFIFVGPRTRLRGPPAIVQVLGNHDNHLHLRIPNAG